MSKRSSKKRSSLWSWLGLFIIAGWAALPVPAHALVRFGNSEIRLIYEQQHTFQFKGDPGNNLEWVQWRNELRLEYSYEEVIRDGLFLNWLAVPLIHKADFSLLYRGRFDPVYLIRDKYRQLYHHDQTRKFILPENDLREINFDADFAEVFGHRLTMRLGRQHIVWGQAALFRSLDMINPLRIDQNGFVGEAFADFRTPLWAVKFFSDLGKVGDQLSNVGVEVFYTPRWRPFSTHLLAEGVWRLRYRDPRLYTADGQGNFVNRLGNFKKHGRVRHPWSLLRVGPNAHADAPDYICNTLRCSPTVANDRTSVVYNIDGSRHQIRGTKWKNSMIGTRLVGVAWEQLDFSLNYLFKRTDPGLGIEWAAVFDATKPGTGTLRADLPTFARGQDTVWFDRCLRQNRESLLLGGDAYGYNSDANPDNDRSGTLCLPVFHFYPWTHIVGFTAAYNDADYTGAVFRVEESWSTKEPRNFGVGLGVAEGNVPCPAGVVTCPGARALREKSKADSAVWRSLVGIDWPRTLPFLPGTFGRDRWFLTFQQYITYQNDNRPTHLNALTNVPRDRLQRWEQLYTLSGAGFFAGGRLEPLWAYGYSVNAKQHLFLIQALWRGLYFQNVDLLVGMALYPGSRFQTDASLLNFYADRDTVWIRLQYAIL